MPGGVAHILCTTARFCVYDEIAIYNIFGSAVKNCLGWGRFIGTFCFVLSAKHMVINKGHITHA